MTGAFLCVLHADARKEARHGGPGRRKNAAARIGWLLLRRGRGVICALVLAGVVRGLAFDDQTPTQKEQNCTMPPFQGNNQDNDRAEEQRRARAEARRLALERERDQWLEHLRVQDEELQRLRAERAALAESVRVKEAAAARRRDGQ